MRGRKLRMKLSRVGCDSKLHHDLVDSSSCTVKTVSVLLKRVESLPKSSKMHLNAWFYFQILLPPDINKNFRLKTVSGLNFVARM